MGGDWAGRKGIHGEVGQGEVIVNWAVRKDYYKTIGGQPTTRREWQRGRPGGEKQGSRGSEAGRSSAY